MSPKKQKSASRKRESLMLEDNGNASYIVEDGIGN